MLNVFAAISPIFGIYSDDAQGGVWVLNDKGPGSLPAPLLLTSAPLASGADQVEDRLQPLPGIAAAEVVDVLHSEAAQAPTYRCR